MNFKNRDSMLSKQKLLYSPPPPAPHAPSQPSCTDQGRSAPNDVVRNDETTISYSAKPWIVASVFKGNENESPLVLGNALQLNKNVHQDLL